MTDNRTRNVNRAYREGREAHDLGMARSACPYPADTQARLDWRRGHDAGAQARRNAMKRQTA